MIQARNPDVVAALVTELEGFPRTPILGEAASSARELVGAWGFEPSWRALAAGERPPDREPEEFEPGTVMRGWQHEAASRVERRHRDEELFPGMNDASRALIRSQAGPGAGMALSTSPLCLHTRFDSQVFRVILLRRLQLPLPLTARNCRCGHHLDVFGHHRAACARAGVLSRRGHALESAIARVCREAGGRVTTNVLLRDLDLEIADRADERRPEVAVDGLPLFGGAQLAIDATIVTPLRGDGSARRRLVVAGVEVGGRWSHETKLLVSQLARAKARQEPWLLRRRSEQAWRLRWGSLIACAVALSLLELPRAVGADGDTPAGYDVERAFLHVGLSLCLHFDLSKKKKSMAITVETCFSFAMPPSTDVQASLPVSLGARISPSDTLRWPVCVQEWREGLWCEVMDPSFNWDVAVASGGGISEVIGLCNQHVPADSALFDCSLRSQRALSRRVDEWTKAQFLSFGLANAPERAWVQAAGAAHAGAAANDWPRSS